MARAKVDRSVLMGTELDRYGTELIPDLRQQVLDLTRALKTLVAADGDRSEANRAEALAAARRALERAENQLSPD